MTRRRTAMALAVIALAAGACSEGSHPVAPSRAEDVTPGVHGRVLRAHSVEQGDAANALVDLLGRQPGVSKVLYYPDTREVTVRFTAAATPAQKVATRQVLDGAATPTPTP